MANAANYHPERDETLHDQELQELQRVQLVRVIRLVDLLDGLKDHDAQEDDTDLLAFVVITHEGDSGY